MIDEHCRSCGYHLEVHRVALLERERYGRAAEPDPDGGCPADELDAMRRWGLL